MSERNSKRGASKKKKQKETFDPYVRIAAFTAPVPALGSARPPPTPLPAEFIDSAFRVTPPLPRAEVGLRVQFRCTVDLVEGDAIVLHLPGFKGPKARAFSLWQQPHPYGINSARGFAAYWTGDTKPRKVKNMVGIPPKQAIVLRCLRPVEEGGLVIFAVPIVLGLVSPDKLAVNSGKIKIEGPSIKYAEGGRVPRQAFLACTGIKKVPIAEELETFELAMAGLVEGGGLGKDDRLVAEELTLEDVEQLHLAVMMPAGLVSPFGPAPSTTTTTAASTAAGAAGKNNAAPAPAKKSVAGATGSAAAAGGGDSGGAATAAALLQPSQLPARQKPYPVAMRWHLAQRVFHEYEEAGGYVKAVMENAIAYVKRHDHLAVHREVAANWGVKVGAVVVLEDMLAALYGGLYPGLTRTVLLVAHLLTLEPADVGATFPVTELPSCSIHAELVGAFRMQATLATAATEGECDGAAGASPGRCEATLRRWAAVVSVLLTAVVPVTTAGGDDEGGGNNSNRIMGGGGGDQQQQRPSGPVLLLPPPPLFAGLRELPAEELHHLRGLKQGDWYVLPSFTLATQQCPAPSLLLPVEEGEDEESPQREHAAAAAAFAASSSGSKKKAKKKSAAAADQAAAAAAPHDGNNSSDDASAIPDNAVLFEIRRGVEALELADLSLQPFAREWLLPFSSSFRVVSVTAHDGLNDLTHVVLTMVGSLAGEVADPELVPEGDRAVARMVARKVRTEVENAESKLPFVARLAYLHVRRNDRRRLHPPTLMRAQYLDNFQAVKRGSEANRTVAEGIVVWQVRAQPAQILDEGVVKPAVWEPLHKRYAPAVEQLFLARTRFKFILEETGILVNLNAFTAEYGGRGARPIRRLVGNKITHEQSFIGVRPYEDTRAMITAASAQIAAMNAKLGITTAATSASDGAGNGSAASKKGGGSAGKPKSRAATAAAA